MLDHGLASGAKKPDLRRRDVLFLPFAATAAYEGPSREDL